MNKNLKTHLKSHKKAYLGLSVAALVIVVLVLSRAVNFGEFIGALRGSLLNVNRYKIMTPVQRLKGPIKPIEGVINTGQFAIQTGTLAVTTTPIAGSYTLSGPQNKSGYGNQVFSLLAGQYTLHFSGTDAYFAPGEQSVTINKGGATTAQGIYTAKPTCTWTVGGWGYYSSGTQSRTVTLNPGDCYGGTPPASTQSCSTGKKK